MNRILTGVTAAAALGGVALAMPTSASANPLIIAPVAAAAILGGTAVTGVAVGAAATHPYAYPPNTIRAAMWPRPKAASSRWGRARLHRAAITRTRVSEAFGIGCKSATRVAGQGQE